MGSVQVLQLSCPVHDSAFVFIPLWNNMDLATEFLADKTINVTA